MYIYLEHKRVDYAVKSEKTEGTGFDSLLEDEDDDDKDNEDINGIATNKF